MSEFLELPEILLKFRGIRRIAFDMDKTLYPHSAAIDETIRNHICLQLAVTLGLEGNIRGEFDYLYEQTKSSTRIIEHFFRINGRTDPLGEIHRFRDKCFDGADISMDINPDIEMCNLISNLEANGIGVDLITASPYERAVNILTRIGFDPHASFDLFLTSNDGDKLSGTVYENYWKMVQSIDHSLLPSNLLVVGDTYEKDYEPAIRSGMQACWFSEKAHPKYPQLNRISNIHQLPSTLEF